MQVAIAVRLQRVADAFGIAAPQTRLACRSCQLGSRLVYAAQLYLGAPQLLERNTRSARMNRAALA